MSNKDSGFVKIYRSFFDHFLWNEDREYSKAEAWIDLIRTARYKKGSNTKMVNGTLVEWERGELLASVRFLKHRWNWNSTGKVTRFLDLLEKQNMITRKTEQGVTVVSICKYSTYNPLEDDDRTATEHEQNNDRTATEHGQGQNSKKEKKEKKQYTPDLDEVISYFTENGYSKQSAKKFYNYYEASIEGTQKRYWRDSKGNTVKSWKQKAQAVWFKEENKIKQNGKSQFRPDAIHL